MPQSLFCCGLRAQLSVSSSCCQMCAEHCTWLSTARKLMLYQEIPAADNAHRALHKLWEVLWLSHVKGKQTDLGANYTHTCFWHLKILSVLWLSFSPYFGR